MQSVSVHDAFALTAVRSSEPDNGLGATDNAGNTTTCAASVDVPHDAVAQERSRIFAEA